MRIHHTNNGMTLIETLIAIAIMSMLVVTASSMLRFMLRDQARNRMINDVEYQSAEIMYQIAQTARNATDIKYPSVGQTDSSATFASLTDGTTFSYKQPTIVMENTRTVNLSSTLVTVTALSFQNITPVSGKGAVRITLSVAATNPGGLPELDYATTLTTTVSLR